MFFKLILGGVRVRRQMALAKSHARARARARAKKKNKQSFPELPRKKKARSGRLAKQKNRGSREIFRSGGRASARERKLRDSRAAPLRARVNREIMNVKMQMSCDSPPRASNLEISVRTLLGFRVVARPFDRESRTLALRPRAPSRPSTHPLDPRAL